MDLNLEINGDLSLTPDGDLATVVGWDEARQAMIRELFTNSSMTLADGTKVPPDCFFDPDYGLGVRKMVGQPFGLDFQATLIQKIKSAVSEQEGVNPNQDPVVEYFTYGSQIFVQIVVPLTSGSQKLTFRVQ